MLAFKNEKMSIILDCLNRIETIEEFENFVYETTKLETVLNPEQYQALLEFNYKSKDSNQKLEDLIKERILSEHEFGLWKLRKELIKFGWYQGREFKIANIDSEKYSEKVLNILKEYGGLKIEKTDKSYREIDFLDKPFIDGDFVFFAMTENTYIHIGLNSKNEYYYRFDITNEYKYAGNCLKTILVKTLFDEKLW